MRKKTPIIILLFILCIFPNGCAGKDHAEKETLSSLTVSDEESAYRIVELLLDERGAFMERVKQDVADMLSSDSRSTDTDGQTQERAASGQFSSKEELLDGLEGFYSPQMALSVCDGWMCADMAAPVGLYAETEDGMLLAASDATVPLLFDDYFISVLSCSEDLIEAFVVCEPEDAGEENRTALPGTYAEEGAELLRIERTEAGWRICGAQSGTVSVHYSDSDRTGQALPDAEALSEGKAADIAEELYTLWADFDYRFSVVSVTGAVASPIEDLYGYAPCDSFSSLADMLEQLGRILTPGCVEQFREQWLEREYPYYLEQDGVLYRYDATSIAGYQAADLIIVRDYTADGLCAYVIGTQNKYDNYRDLVKISAVYTEAGWRIRQLDCGSLSLQTDEAFSVYYELQSFNGLNR